MKKEEVEGKNLCTVSVEMKIQMNLRHFKSSSFNASSTLYILSNVISLITRQTNELYTHNMIITNIAMLHWRNQFCEQIYVYVGPQIICNNYA